MKNYLIRFRYYIQYQGKTIDVKTETVLVYAVSYGIGCEKILKIFDTAERFENLTIE